MERDETVRRLQACTSDLSRMQSSRDELAEVIRKHQNGNKLKEAQVDEYVAWTLLLASLQDAPTCLFLLTFTLTCFFFSFVVFLFSLFPFSLFPCSLVLCSLFSVLLSLFSFPCSSLIQIKKCVIGSGQSSKRRPRKFGKSTEFNVGDDARHQSQVHCKGE